ncbi:LysR substrate-binding domain-containing protein [Enterobacter roggenkampii]|uniref:LysR substrate-binding domain-containing protein n=1 Tax=Enterobacter roggenkampii TaxID=1812935 RepID=UPI001F60A112|nr:LysR substrate-binding domain-containing protein [Enterobacter roggenkampii]
MRHLSGKRLKGFYLPHQEVRLALKLFPFGREPQGAAVANKQRVAQPILKKINQIAKRRAVLLQRQAHLLMRQVKAFEAFAREVPHGATQDLTLVYDPFTPRAFLHGVIAEMAVRKIRLSLICASRDESERLLANNDADLAICQARNRSVGNDMEWRALGAIEMDFYAASGLFADSASPLSLLDLSLVPQVVMHPASDEPVARRLQISGHTLFTNEPEMLRGLLERGCGWGFLPTHFHAGQWQNVKRLHTEVGSQGIGQTMVTIWKPGSDKRSTIAETLSLLPDVWKHSAL